MAHTKCLKWLKLPLHMYAAVAFPNTQQEAHAVMTDRTAYRTYGITAEPNRRLINLYTGRQTDRKTHS